MKLLQIALAMLVGDPKDAIKRMGKDQLDKQFTQAARRFRNQNPKLATWAEGDDAKAGRAIKNALRWALKH